MCQVLAVGYALAWSNKLLGEVMGSQPADIIASIVSKSLGLLLSHPETLARCLPELLGGFDSLEARARGVIENKHPTDIESPPSPPPRVCMRGLLRTSTPLKCDTLLLRHVSV